MDESRRIVLVTGGTRGIGAAIAHAFDAQGDKVIVCARNPVEGCPHPFLKADLREADTCKSLVAEVVDQHGRLDVLVNNAGGSPPADTSSASPRFSNDDTANQMIRGDYETIVRKSIRQQYVT